MFMASSTACSTAPYPALIVLTSLAILRIGAFKLVLAVPVGKGASGEAWLSFGYLIDILLIASGAAYLFWGRRDDWFLLLLIMVSLSFLTIGYSWLLHSCWRQSQISPDS